MHSAKLCYLKILISCAYCLHKQLSTKNLGYLYALKTGNAELVRLFLQLQELDTTAFINADTVLDLTDAKGAGQPHDEYCFFICASWIHR